jgi:hypothetical protein
MKAGRRIGDAAPHILNLNTPDGSERSSSRTNATKVIPPNERAHGSHRRGGWLSSGASLDDLEKRELSHLCREFGP